MNRKQLEMDTQAMAKVWNVMEKYELELEELKSPRYLESSFGYTPPMATYEVMDQAVRELWKITNTENKELVSQGDYHNLIEMMYDKISMTYGFQDFLNEFDSSK